MIIRQPNGPLNTSTMKKNIFLIALLLTVLFNFQSVAQVITSQEELAVTDTLEASLKKAQSLTDQGNTEEAIEIYVRLMGSYPDNKEAVQGWIMAFVKNGQVGPAEVSESMAVLHESYPRNTGILFFKAFIEASSGQNEAALKDLNDLIKIQPDTVLNYILKAQALAALEEYGEAFEALDIATSLDPERQDLWEMKAGALAKMGKFDEALAAVNMGLELDPNDASSLYNRACIYSLKGDKASALADLEKSISLDPRFKKQAPQDEDFKSLYDDEEFRRLTFQ